MCGRYATARKRQELLDEFQVELDATEDDLDADYNVAPTKPVPVVVARAPRPEERPGDAAADPETGPEPDREPVRQLRVMRWGLVPSWAKDLSIGSRLINARVETAHEKPSFRRAFARRRCLLPADGYFEWYTAENAGAKPRKQPFFIRPKDGAIMAMAGLYELWRDPGGDAGAEWVWSCTVITTAASDDLGRIHDRMPMVMPPERWEAWLDPARSGAEEVRGLLTPAMAGTMEAFPVSTAVNNVRNNGAELIRPLPDEGISGEYAGTLF